MWPSILQHAWRHAELSLDALACAAVLGCALGVAAWAWSSVRGLVLGAAALGRTIPSIALLTLLLPVLGIGIAPAIVALTLLALPPVLVNVDVALREVSPAVLDAATGLGMTPLQRFARVSVPLALPVALSGVRTASVEVIGSATLATFIGAGGLGDDIVRALQTSDIPLLIAATVTVAAMAFVAEFLLGRLAARVEVH
ncbi:MAG: ABC transporter permease [Candidatus Eremiobacteraeota bacterium]|nr:ABC transporter permease [Candidatus Eremiobacteraeota bacterium]